MKLIANVTLVTRSGEIPPGGDIEVKDAAEARSLIERGFAAAPIKAADATVTAGAGGQTAGNPDA